MVSRRQWLGVVALPVATSVVARLAVLALDLLWPDHHSTVQRLLAYDGGWYAYIARHGYPSALPAPGHQSPLAFFPAYPLLVRGTVDVTGLAVAQAGLLVNLVLSAVAVAGVTLVASRVLPREAAVAVGVLWSVLPTAYLLSLDYSEALYVACAAFALLAVLDGRWWWAGLLTGVAAVTRPTGVAVVLALLVAVGVALRTSRKPLVSVPVALAFPMALVVWQHQATGSWQAWYVAEQRGWGGSSFGLLRLGLTTLVHPLRNAWFDAVVLLCIGALLLAVQIVRRERGSWHPALLAYPGFTLLALVVAKVPVFSSAPRVLWTAFPLLLPLGGWLARGRRLALVAGGSFAAMAVLSVLVVTGAGHVVP